MNDLLQEQRNTNYTDIELERRQIPNYRALYILNDSAEVDQFTRDVEPLLPPYHMIKKTSDIYARVAGPLEQAGQMARQVFLGGIGASVVVLMLVTILFLKDRKHELAILLSLGEKRSHIIIQVLLELLFVAFIAIILSLVTGNLLSGALSESMVTDQLVQDAQTGQVSGDRWGDEYSFGVFSSQLKADDLASNYRIELTPRYISLMILVSLGTILLSGAAPLVYILRLNPKKIMMWFSHNH